MWANVLVEPYRFERVEIDPPDSGVLGPGEVILKVLAGAICGSDVPAMQGTVSMHAGDKGSLAANYPGFPMHEIVGEVVGSTGELTAGTRMVGWSKHNNGLAELIVADAASLHPVPPAGRAVHQTVLQPLACVLHALGRVGDVSGRRAVVLGQGPLGLLFSHALHAAGAAHVTGVDPVDRSDVAAVHAVLPGLPEILLLSTVLLPALPFLRC